MQARAAERYSLTHLHPFIQQIELATTEKHSARVVQLHVSFGLHTFTRAVGAHDKDEDFYRDNREVRAFCPARYQRSLGLPGIIRTLEVRRCEFARGERPNPLPCPARPCATRHGPATSALTFTRGAQKRETPLVAGFRQSGSTYLPPGRTSCEAGVHRAGFRALRDRF
jgi:hypothetical protein